ncbi:MAG: glycosyltransferase family 2 protein [Lachnospiraceae bacterium]|nr:glycosyltransferase family 2 protein [Lachnospiraceae bacterium]
MNNQLVSVVIPTYNAEKYIEKCLKKVLAQTYGIFEVIIVDDGSQDGTLKICNKIAATDSRVRVIEAEHGGVSAARNCGLSQAKGEFVTFFDADDFPEKNLLEEYIKAYEYWKGTVSFILCGMYWENYNNRLVPREKNILESGRGYKEGGYYLLHKHDVSELAWDKILNFVTNKVYLMSVIKACGIRFADTVQIAEDLQFNLDYLDSIDGFMGVINKPLYHYVKHAGPTLSSSYYEGAIEHVCQSFDKLLEFVKRQPGVSRDDEYVIESIYLMDWVSRLSMLMEDKETELSKKEKYKICNAELQKPRFREILVDSHKGRKIGHVRYFLLRHCCFKRFFWLRKIYHMLKMRDDAEGGKKNRDLESV